MKAPADPALSVVIPARDEEAGLPGVLEEIREALDPRKVRYEIIVVDDGSADGTGEAARAAGARVVRHPYGIGNGAAVKSGIRAARAPVIALLDGDGQHPPGDLPRLLEALTPEYDMVVGARLGRSGREFHRRLANLAYAALATWVSGVRIPDLTSGFRVLRTPVARKFLYLLPNTFSYPSTLTLSLLRSGRPVRFVPFRARERSGRSKIRVLRGGARFFLIILRIATFFSPLRVFLPASILSFTAGLALYADHWRVSGHPEFTNGMQLLFLLGALLFFLALVAEQVAALRFDRSEDD